MQRKKFIRNKQELQEIKQGAFANLREYSYFTYIRIDGKPFSIQNGNSFSVEMIATKARRHEKKEVEKLRS
jgi:ABC-type uncharacterized transport system substrate-binding protein